MKKFFKFEMMLTPNLIRVLFPIFLVASALASITWGVKEFHGFTGAVVGFVAFCIIGLIGRVIAEHLIVIFGIYERLEK